MRLPQKVGVGMARRMGHGTGDYLSATDALRAGLVTEVVGARRSAAGRAPGRPPPSMTSATNQAAVGGLLDSYHRIDAEQTQAGLWYRGRDPRGPGCR